MATQVYLILGILIAGFITVILVLKSLLTKPKDDEALKVMMEWMKDIKQGTENSKQITEKNIQELNRAINDRLDNAGRVIAALTKELGGVAQIGPDIRRLTETLASPKLRGNFGEDVLETLMHDVFPKEFCKSQFRFKNGEVVDAVLCIGDLMLPIDSKFSMENYRLYKEAQTEEVAENLKKAFLKDVKKRIDEISKKYILPQEGTFDYALMFVPSEGIYMEIASNPEVAAYARNKNVTMVGPNTLVITLKAFLVSLRGQQISKAAQRVLALINGIKQESEKFNKTLDTLSNHVKNTSNTMGTVVDGYAKLKSNINNAASLQLEKEAKAEELPQVNIDKLL